MFKFGRILITVVYCLRGPGEEVNASALRGPGEEVNASALTTLGAEVMPARFGEKHSRKIALHESLQV